MTSHSKRLLLASTLLVGMPSAVHAQDASKNDAPDNSGEAIVVTGSRLSNPNLERAAPIMNVTAKDLEVTGQVNVEAILKELPQVLPGATAASNNPGGGVATADLRGLGTTRTLILVNGRRYVSYDSSQIVDLNTIPMALLDHVDVVTGGRSAVYGSDAVSGVINFVTKQNYEGLETNANYRLTGYDDGGTFNTYVLAGKNFADGRGNITIYADYIKRSAIKQSARSYTAVTQTDDGAGGLTAGGSGSIPAGRFVVGGSAYKFTQDGGYSAYTSPDDLYNYASENYLQVPQTRKMINLQAHYEVSDAVDLYAEGQFIKNNVKNQLAPTPATGSFSIDTDSSFLSSSTQSLLSGYDTDGDGYTTVSLYRRMVEVGDRISDLDSTAVRGVLGARGELGKGWNYDAYFSYARTHQVEHQYGNISRSRLQQALLTTYDSSGNLVCSDTSNGCVPIDVFGAGNISSDAASFIAITTRNASTIVEKVASAAITNNELFDLGAGPAGIAFGAEYRSEHGSYNPDAELSSGDVIGFNASEGLSGGYNVKELFTEVDVPVLADKPFIHRLDVNAAYRFSYYSTAAKAVSTYSFGTVWAPIADISLRGQYSRAVRAPTVSNLYSGQSQSYEAATDPCTTSTATSNANLNASCLANGVSTSAIGTSYDGGSTQIESYIGGNPDLREETADTYTLGAVFEPTFLPRFSLTVDWYKIKIANYITSAGTANIISACYGTSANNWTPYDTSYCSLLPRDSTGTISGAIDYLSNSGGVKTSGVDFEARYWFPVNLGKSGDNRIDLRLSGTHLNSWTFTPVAAISDLTVNCAGKFGLLCENVYAKWRLNGRATLQSGDTTVSLAWRHLSPVNDDDDSTDYTVEHIKAYDYFDLSASLLVAKKFTWQLGVNNLFNRKPPVLGDNQEQSNTYPSTYDVYGRTFFTGVTIKFF